MSLDLTIAKNVDKAFKTLKSLSRSAAFTEESATSFDFVSGETDSVGETKTITLLPTKIETEEDSTIRTEFVARAVDFDISRYSTFTIDSVVYSIESIVEYEGVLIVNTTRRSY